MEDVVVICEEFLDHLFNFKMDWPFNGFNRFNGFDGLAFQCSFGPNQKLCHKSLATLFAGVSVIVFVFIVWIILVFEPTWEKVDVVITFPIFGSWFVAR